MPRAPAKLSAALPSQHVPALMISFVFCSKMNITGKLPIFFLKPMLTQRHACLKFKTRVIIPRDYWEKNKKNVKIKSTRRFYWIKCFNRKLSALLKSFFVSCNFYAGFLECFPFNGLTRPDRSDGKIWSMFLKYLAKMDVHRSNFI